MAIKSINHGQKNPETGLNWRQEQFCRFYVSGLTTAQAYESAGFDVGSKTGKKLSNRAPGDGVAQRPTAENLARKLLRHPHVKARINQLKMEQAAIAEQQRLNFIDRWSIDMEKMTIMLMEDRHYARTGELALRDAEGNRTDEQAGPPQDWRPDPRAAVQATMGLAKLHGLLIDRKEVTVIDAMQNMNNNELLEFIGKMQSKLGMTIDVQADPAFPPSKMSRSITAQDVVIGEELSGDDSDEPEDPSGAEDAWA